MQIYFNPESLRIYKISVIFIQSYELGLESFALVSCKVVICSSKLKGAVLFLTMNVCFHSNSIDKPCSCEVPGLCLM